MHFTRLIAGMLIFECVFSAVAQVADPPGRIRSRAAFRAGQVLAQEWIKQGDLNEDERLSKAELEGVSNVWFDRLDPDSAGILSQEEFLRRFGDASKARGMNGTRALNFFTAVDLDKDMTLTRQELTQAFGQWFEAWNENDSGQLSEGSLASGIESILPRTNLSGATGSDKQVRLPGLPTPPPAPVLTPDDEMETMQLVDGFYVELAVSEPLIEDPIALSFDADGRLYVLEMRSYQLDIDRSNERDPISRISLLEDTNQDGRFEKSTVFIDGLILPRALAAIRGGVMYVSDYKLYYARDTDGDGQADHNELLDANYGGGNVEHAPNGLMQAMDNWIYNAKSSTRYRWIGDTLVKQRTENRGQWGITQDNYGRLIYNINNSQLLGDYAPPNYMGRNSNYPTDAGLNLFVASDQRIFSARMNTGVNRGYLPDVLDAAGRLYVFASSCSPLIYRGDNYPSEFVGNAFVADPAANLIKRNLVFDDNLTLSSRFAYEDREFLASTDERFRPVNLYNSPDGTLWMVDLYRGIAQYSQFMTSYLRSETLERELEKGIHLGRVYRVVADGRTPSIPPRLSQESSTQLVGHLSHPNGWIRDTAQRLLIERGDRSVVPQLVDLISRSADHLARIHALWTLEGLFVLLTSSSSDDDDGFNLATIDETVPMFGSTNMDAGVYDTLLAAINDSNPKVQVAAMRVTESLTATNSERRGGLFQSVAALPVDTTAEVMFQAALTAGNLAKPDVLPVLARIAARHASHLIIREATLSGLQNWELQFLQTLLTDPQWLEQKPGRTALLQALSEAVTREKQPAKVELLLTLAASERVDQLWRRRALLAGIAANVSSRVRNPIPFAREPSALQVLARADDPETRERSQQIRNLFSWPGHQSESAASTPTRSLTSSEATMIAEGEELYLQICAGCHGANGEGLRPIAPPLVNSEWVTDSVGRLIRIALHGIQGTIDVDGNTYEPPAVLPEMPPLAALSDAQLASVLSYVRHDWEHAATPVSAEQISAIRSEYSARATPWTETELLQIK